ncbi:MAG TPA: type II toxin-antitoxin system VapC family toxin [Rhizomicrobium sp.]
MIVVDTSAPVAIILGEGVGIPCLAAIERETQLLMSAGTLAELLIVAARLRIADQILGFLESAEFEFVNVTREAAAAVGAAYRKWGKGFHPAALNFGDCFAYALAKQHACALLFVGNDFARTDVQSVL